jgi:conjugative relaxase-like TrwC/TraI family protein
LGLSGEVEQARFRELLDGRISDSTKLMRTVEADGKVVSKERLGYDLTFSAPKGVSLQALVHGDASIIEAHDKAVAAAIREAERLSQARITVNKKTGTENTNNLVVAKFRHETSRALDPDLHTHAFVLNMTQRSDGEWRALKNDGVFNSSMFLGNVYKAELARELEKAGFQLRYERNGTFDLAHFSDEQIREFSSRSQQIEAALAAKGLDRSTASYAEKNQAALATRDKKQGGIDREELRQVWLGGRGPWVSTTTAASGPASAPMPRAAGAKQRSHSTDREAPGIPCRPGDRIRDQESDRTPSGDRSEGADGYRAAPRVRRPHH